MRDVLQYFDLINKIIELSPTVLVELDLEQFDQKRGALEGVIYFTDGSRLEFTERIVIERARPIKREYRYQYVRAQAAVFRYDNAPHHPHLPGFPHHKHVGRRVISAPEPTLKDVLLEVTQLLPAETDAAATPPPRRSRQTPKKRRRRT